MLTAELMTPDPTQWKPCEIEQPCTVPSSPNVPWSTGEHDVHAQSFRTRIVCGDQCGHAWISGQHYAFARAQYLAERWFRLAAFLSMGEDGARRSRSEPAAALQMPMARFVFFDRGAEMTEAEISETRVRRSVLRTRRRFAPLFFSGHEFVWVAQTSVCGVPLEIPCCPGSPCADSLGGSIELHRLKSRY